MKYFNKIIGVLFASVLMFSSGKILATDNYPDLPSDAETTHTPYTMTKLPGTSIQLGLPDAGGTPPGGLPYYNTSPGAFSSQVFYYFFNDGSGGKTNYFRAGGSEVDPANRHFDLSYFKSQPQHTQVFQNTTFEYSSTRQMTIYFIDTAAAFTNALGIIDVTKYPTSTSVHPLTNMQDAPCLLFPFSKTAIPSSRTMRNIDSGFARSNNTTPYLLSDFVQFSLDPGQTVDFFLAADIVGKDAIDPWNATGVWFTDLTRNWGDSALNNFQHFQFYTMPDLDILTPGFQNFLVAIEDKGVFNGTDKDFNDLVFLFQLSTPIPEPAFYLLLGSLLIATFIIVRKKPVRT
jgi:hypothetical protein